MPISDDLTVSIVILLELAILRQGYTDADKELNALIENEQMTMGNEEYFPLIKARGEMRREMVRANRNFEERLEKTIKIYEGDTGG